MRAPFHRATYGNIELTAIGDALRAGRLEGDGPHTDQAVRLLARHLGHDRVLLTTTGVHDELGHCGFAAARVATAVLARGDDDD